MIIIFMLRKVQALHSSAQGLSSWKLLKGLPTSPL